MDLNNVNHKAFEQDYINGYEAALQDIREWVGMLHAINSTLIILLLSTYFAASPTTILQRAE